RGREREEREAEREYPPPSEAVSERTGREQKSGEHQRVAVDHPLQAAHSAAEVVPERGQRHVDDGGVEDDHEIAEADCDEGHVTHCWPRTLRFGTKYLGTSLVPTTCRETPTLQKSP